MWPFAAWVESVVEQLGVAVQPDVAVVHGVVARFEKVDAQFDAVVRVVAAQMRGAVDFEAGRCFECQMKVVTFVVVVTTAGELDVVLAALNCRTARRGRDKFDLRCLSERHCDFERY